MKLSKFLLHETKALELCVIRDCGWIVATCWIDYEDLFRIPPDLANREVKGDEWGHLPIVNGNKEKSKIPCHYVDV